MSWHGLLGMAGVEDEWRSATAGLQAEMLGRAVSEAVYPALSI